MGELEDIKYGDVQAFERAFHSYYRPLCAHAYGILHNATDAEEIVQNVFVKFWNKKDHITIATSFKSYLYQSVKNECLNLIKHQRVVQDHVQTTLQNSNEGIEDHLDARELQERIDAAINELPPERRKIFLLNRSEGLKYREIAEKLTISVKTVENQMGKALKFLRSALSEYLSLGLIILSRWLF